MLPEEEDNVETDEYSENIIDSDTDDTCNTDDVQNSAGIDSKHHGDKPGKFIFTFIGSYFFSLSVY